jgi:putative Ca2+/H+ antiporter (TMEM165/GDT1 family)
MITCFLLAMVAVVLAEMGDKTQLLAMAFAARFRWQTVLWAVLAATLVNHLMAVATGNVITQFLPMSWIKLVAAASFIIFALWTIRGDSLNGEEQGHGRSPFWTVAIAFFIAEMGDKTQLMTIALAAEEAVKVGGTGWIAKAQQIVPVWIGTTCGMMIADAFGIVVGIVLHKHIPERLVKWIAAGCFAGFGLIGLHEALDQLLSPDVNMHHLFLIAAMFSLPAAMWFVSRLTEQRVAPLAVLQAADVYDATGAGDKN